MFWKGLSKGFVEAGFNTQVCPLSSFTETYGLESDEDEDNNDDEGEDDEDGNGNGESASDGETVESHDELWA